MENKIDGLWMPLEILQDKSLNANEKLVLSIIKALDNSRGCFAHNQYIADLIGLKKRSVSEIITNLKKKGYVNIEIQGYNSRTINVISKSGEVAEQVQEQAPVKEENKVVSLSSKKNNTCKPGYKSGNKNNTGKSNAEKGKFFGGYSHGFNYNQLEELETQYVEQQSHAMHHDNLSDRAKELLLQVHIDEEPSEWLGVNQLKI